MSQAGHIAAIQVGYDGELDMVVVTEMEKVGKWRYV